MGVERMTDSIPAKRRRGGQPGNQNAQGNRGNLRPRRNFGNRGGKGAPTANQYARRRPRNLQAILLAEYQNNREAREWIEANRDALDGLTGEATCTDPVDIAKCLQLTPEYIAQRGREFEFGLFVKPGPQ
jgi:hypothetical protein